MFGLIGNFGPWELVLILVIVLIIVGPGKLPQVGQSMGKALQNFRKAKEEDFDELEEKRKNNGSGYRPFYKNGADILNGTFISGIS